jgi:hypothetical protein
MASIKEALSLGLALNRSWRLVAALNHTLTREAMMDSFRGKKKNKFFFFKNQKGQFAIEAVLLTAVLIGAFTFATANIKQKGYIPKLFGKPIQSLRNMTAFGTFRETCIGLGANKKSQTLSQCHPNSITRALSSKPE